MSDLTRRQKQLLYTIIHLYLEGKPHVSSLLLNNLEIFNISSATIRNEFVKLTQKGYLIKSHYASGRIPTLKALQLFINEKVSKNQNFETITLPVNNNIDIFTLILAQLHTMSNHLIFVVTPDIATFKNSSKLIDDIYNNIDVHDTSKQLVLKKIFYMLDEPKLFYKLLANFYSQYTNYYATLIPVHELGIPGMVPLFIGYLPIISQDKNGFIGIIGRPDNNFIKILVTLKHISDMVSTI